MNVVDFAEGILGLDRILPDGRQARYVVSKCLRETAKDQDEGVATTMCCIANSLEVGSRIDIEDIRRIGEKPLYQTQRLFLNAEKEKSCG